MQQLSDFILHHWQLWLAFVVILGLLLFNEFKDKWGRFKLLSPQEAVLLMNRHDALVLDIRKKEAFDKQHIRQAIHFTVDEIEKKRNLGKNFERPLILVYEASDPHGKIGNALMQQGFKQIYGLQGGIEAWRNAGFPLVKTS